jgi:hypothetical protein
MSAYLLNILQEMKKRFEGGSGVTEVDGVDGSCKMRSLKLADEKEELS